MSTEATTILPPVPDHLPDDPATLKRMILELLATIQEERQERAQLRERLHLLLERLYGRRSERVNPHQLLLFSDMNQPVEPVEPKNEEPATVNTTQPADQPKPRGHGRKRPAKDLLHKEVHHHLTEAERACPCCGTQREEVGTETTPQLDYEPASFFVNDHIEHKYACPKCRKQGQPQFVATQKPEQPLGKGSPGPGLLAHLIVNKYLDHLPLYRQEQIHKREGLELARSTNCDWMAQCANKLGPLYNLMRDEVLKSQVVHTDDTPVKRQDAADNETSLGRFWVYLGDRDHPLNVFDFTLNRRRDGPQEFLKNYSGYLQADAFSGYDALYLPDVRTGEFRIHEVACNAHARRKFYEARGSDATLAHQALAYYGRLYEIERQAKPLDDDLRLRLRQDLAVPILEEFHGWLVAQQPRALPKSKIGEAFTYALNQWTALCRYTTAGFLAIDNNVAEREMKRIAIGRKNWLFVGSAQGGKTAAVLFSFTSSCHRLGINAWDYLKDVLTRLPTTPLDRLGELLPNRWQAAQKESPPADSPTVVST